MPADPGPTIRGYRLGLLIGRGGMGEVYSATRLADGAPCAVKVLRPDLAGQPDYRRRLRDEAERVSGLNAEGVVKVHEVGEDDDPVWFAMDLAPGPDLQTRLDERGPLEPDAAARLIAEVADTVAAVHRAGVVHRDLKPANVLVGPERPLVADFGVAQPLATVRATLGSASGDWSASTPDGSSAHAGTVAYMAPEQWRGERTTGRADVYALGGTLYAALTGEPPFPDRSLPELAYAVAMSPAPAPSGHGAPVAFDAVVARAMAKDPADRFPDATAFAAAVRAAARGESPAVPTRRLPRRRPLAIAAVLAVALGAAGLVWWSPWSADDDSAHRVVCARDLSLRDRPKGTPVDRLDHGVEVEVDRSRDEGPWSYVHTSDGRQGWVLNQWLGASCP
ncbi:serine/threonine protein kinase [Actinosynnema sp. NPDC020468]|uniref:serine/threonine protein kinase n=1 Tax=Actinosynnema sp. NPDC020468 TaxID=3154488 RepID=UPI0033F79D28